MFNLPEDAKDKNRVSPLGYGSHGPFGIQPSLYCGVQEEGGWFPPIISAKDYFDPSLSLV